MPLQSVPTRGRTLDYAAGIYDIFEPMLLFGQEAEINGQVIRLLALEPHHRILDLGCGTGVLSKAIADKLSLADGGLSMGIDAAGKMIEGARKKRGSEKCRFEVAAAEDLPFEDASFDAVTSTFFFHHIQLDLKQRALAEAYRVLKPKGKLVIADMHVPTTMMGAIISHASRWVLCQPQIGENIRGVLPGLIAEAGFPFPKTVAAYFGYVAVFTSQKQSKKKMP